MSETHSTLEHANALEHAYDIYNPYSRIAAVTFYCWKDYARLMRRKKLFTLQVLTWTQADLFFGFFLVLKPNLSMKILSINNFTIKLLSDLSIGVQLKRIFDTKKFSSKVDNRQYLIWKTVFLWKSCLIITLLPVFLVPFKWSLRRLLKCFVKSLIDNIFKERLGFRV